MKLTLALAQTAPYLANIEKNIDRHVEEIKRAISAKTDIIVFPELSLTGYMVRDSNFELAMRSSDPRLDVFRELSADITIILGAIEEDENFGVYNAAFVFDEGTTQTYRKIYPPDYGIFEERRYFLPGKAATPVRTRHGLLGVLVCEDLWHMPLPLLMAYQGAQLLVVLSASPAQVPGRNGLTNLALNTQHQTAYARLLGVNLAFVNRTGFEDGVHYWGGSQFINAHGIVTQTADEFAEQTLIVEASDTDVRDARRDSRHFLDDDPAFLLRELERIQGTQ